MATVSVAERTCERCGKSFTPRRGAAAGRYCSTGCYHAALRKHQLPLTLPCAQCGESFSTRGRGPDPRYCSTTCYGRSIAKPAPVKVCRQCGEQREYRPGKNDGPYCSRGCSGSARRNSVTRPCERCGNLVTTWKSRAAKGRGRFCSRACIRVDRIERACERCSRPMELLPNQAGQRYCSHECYFGHEVAPRRPAREIACQVCGAKKRVSAARLAEGYGKFCSRACYAESKRGPRLSLECRQCHKRFSVVPSQAGRRLYCRRRCATLARAPREYQCRACPKTFHARPWRAQRYCGLACANRGRKRRRSPEREQRNSRVLELHASGLDAFRIAKRLEVEMGLAMEPATVRTIVFRSKAR